MAIDTNHFKQLLEEEKARLTSELQSVGRINPDNPKDWEPVPTEKGRHADPNEAADDVEAYGENTAITNDLEIRYNNVARALKKIEEGTYGICEIGDHEIEKDRLEANPAARTCKEHLEEEGTLPR